MVVDSIPGDLKRESETLGGGFGAETTSDTGVVAAETETGPTQSTGD